MIYPEYSLSKIARMLIRLEADYKSLNDTNWANFQLLCMAWKERTGNEVSFAEMKNIIKVYGK